MLGLIPVVLLAAVFCAAFYYWLSRRGRAGGKRESRQERRSVSLLTECLAYIGAMLVLAGGGVAVGQDWPDITPWQRAGIFAGTAVFFLAAGLVVLRIADPAIQRMIGVVWFVSAACAGAAAGLAAGGALGSSGAVATLIAGLAVAAYSAVLWLVRRRELQLVAMFAGVTLALCATFISIAGAAGPRLAIALGLWVLGVGWVIVGWQYPQPLWTTVPLATAIALIGPGVAVWQHGWVFAVGIGTAAAAMVASVSRRNPTLLAAGTLALFGYVTAAVVRYFHASLGLPTTLAACGVLLLMLALVMAQIRRSTQRRLAENESGAGLRLAESAEQPAGEEHETLPGHEALPDHETLPDREPVPDHERVPDREPVPDRERMAGLPRAS
ncbi:MAG TPA: hypothetical protein VF162_21905 [Streptosporangiaceae bacterium]